MEKTNYESLTIEQQAFTLAVVDNGSRARRAIWGRIRQPYASMPTKGSKGLSNAMAADGSALDISEITEFLMKFPQFEKVVAGPDGAWYAFFRSGSAEEDAQLVELLNGFKLFDGKVVRDWLTSGEPTFTVIQAIQAGLLPDPPEKRQQGTKYFAEMAAWIEAQGFGVTVTDFHGKPGLVFTGAFFEFQQALREHVRLEPIRAKRAAHTPQVVKCPNCGVKLLQTTFHFDADEPLTGAMLSPYGIAESENWSLGFGSTDTGESLVCLECGRRLPGADDRLPAECLCPAE